MTKPFLLLHREKLKNLVTGLVKAFNTTNYVYIFIYVVSLCSAMSECFKEPEKDILDRPRIKKTINIYCI